MALTQFPKRRDKCADEIRDAVALTTCDTCRWPRLCQQAGSCYWPPLDPSEPGESRRLAGHTQAQAALSVGVAPRTWQDWEAGIATMPPGLLLLYRHRAGLERIPFRVAKSLVA